MGGNRDESHFKDDGINVVSRICELRPDCKYVGFAKADIPLMPGISIRMWHPTGGVPYTSPTAARRARRTRPRTG
jgi:hypothetical protein